MTRTGLISWTLAVALTVACSGTDRNDAVVNDQNRADTVGTGGNEVTGAARDFTEKTIVGNMAEVELGRMAMQRASNAEVKGFGDMMVRDHTQALEQLKQVAATHQIAVPSQLDEPHRDLRDELSVLNGAEFDREYINAMVEGHENMIDLLQTRADEDRAGDNKGATQPEDTNNRVEASLNQWAATSLPTVRHHLDEARRVRDGLNRRTTQR